MEIFLHFGNEEPQARRVFLCFEKLRGIGKQFVPTQFPLPHSKTCVVVFSASGLGFEEENAVSLT